MVSQITRAANAKSSKHKKIVKLSYTSRPENISWYRGPIDSGLWNGSTSFHWHPAAASASRVKGKATQPRWTGWKVLINRRMRRNTMVKQTISSGKKAEQSKKRLPTI